MSSNSVLPQLYLLCVSKDEDGAFAKVNTVFSEEEKIIRLGIDNFTYKNLNIAVSTRYFDKMPGLDYEYKLLIAYRCDPVNKEFAGYFECILGKQHKTLEFPCSKSFIESIEWVSKIRSIEQLEHLEWKD
ncbi:hypothetical protein [Pontibacillus marinus]|uniref:Uncharacterized protein n=1 Tax=Pontibacillus marinus BH030004 = DSM 16465 TaxID=1385511 RepID=A0A0A5FQS0_9BACI|nr:hypothetical protein [Pontibacillus marinus]KGX83116.1 hypothetical protein N783_06465 [Pontibacillus marinus BH030004 = DSM 16465]